MDALKAPVRTPGRLAGGIVLGIAIGLLSPYMLAFAALVFLAPVLTARLYVFAGALPAAVCCAVQIAMAYGNFGPGLAAVLAILLVAPLALTLRQMRPGGGALEQCLRLTLPAWMLCAALALTVAQWALGASVADYLAGQFRGQIESLPVGVQDMLLSAFYGGETPSSLNVLTFYLGFLEPAERALSIESLAEGLRNTLAVQTTGWLLSAAALTALLTTAWPLRLLAREGVLEKERWRPLSRWHLPGALAVAAAIGCVAAMIVMAVSPVSQALSVCVAVLSLTTLAFRVQAVASLERRLGAAGLRSGARAALIAFLLLVFGEVLAYYGMASALFGPTYGVATRFLARKRGDGDDFYDGDDPGEDGSGD
ncbi:MAG TPA: hypothetical protein IAA75_01570 [Candidatus Pullichristensenella avicola]|nr:hypothetical protein [Candidatus Pullichristensenella avicola]